MVKENEKKAAGRTLPFPPNMEIENAVCRGENREALYPNIGLGSAKKNGNPGRIGEKDESCAKRFCWASHPVKNELTTKKRSGMWDKIAIAWARYSIGRKPPHGRSSVAVVSKARPFRGR